MRRKEGGEVTQDVLMKTWLRGMPLSRTASPTWASFPYMRAESMWLPECSDVSGVFPHRVLRSIPVTGLQGSQRCWFGVIVQVDAKSE